MLLFRYLLVAIHTDHVSRCFHNIIMYINNEQSMIRIYTECFRLEAQLCLAEATCGIVSTCREQWNCRCSKLQVECNVNTCPRVS